MKPDITCLKSSCWAAFSSKALAWNKNLKAAELAELSSDWKMFEQIRTLLIEAAAILTDTLLDNVKLPI